MIAIDLNAREPRDSIKTQFKPIESQQSGRQPESLMAALEIVNTRGHYYLCCSGVTVLFNVWRTVLISPLTVPSFGHQLKLSSEMSQFKK